MGRLISLLEGYGLTGEELATVTMKSIIEATQKIPGNIIDRTKTVQLNFIQLQNIRRNPK